MHTDGHAYNIQTDCLQYIYRHTDKNTVKHKNNIYTGKSRYTDTHKESHTDIKKINRLTDCHGIFVLT